MTFLYWCELFQYHSISAKSIKWKFLLPPQECAFMYPVPNEPDYIHLILRDLPMGPIFVKPNIKL